MSAGVNPQHVAYALKAQAIEDDPSSGPTAQGALNGVPGKPGHEELLRMHWLTLCFQSPGMEAEYMADVAKQRRPVLMCIFVFDVAIYLFRLAVYGASHGRQDFISRLSLILPQMMNMIALHSIVGWVNRRSRRLGSAAACQEELLLGVAMSLAICTLLVSLTSQTAQDYVFATMFLICTSSFLKIRWLWGTAVLTLPLLVVEFGGKRSQIPAEAIMHLVVAWSVGGLMSLLADSYRRQMFANQQLARASAEKEIQEAKARTVAQRQLADAQAQAAARALTVAKEKAANEAKSEFMSLMCHEVRTPLNGCLASAEMLLETKLEVEQRELAKTIRVSGSILLSTVSNFLDFFKTEAGKQLDVVCSDVEVQELVCDVHCIIEAMLARSSDVILMTPQLINVPQFMLGDSDRLRGILLNLYTNAAKFTRTGAIALRVSLHGAGYRPTPAEHSNLYQPAAEIPNGHATEKREDSIRKGAPAGQTRETRRASQETNARINGLLNSHTIPVLEQNRIADERQAADSPPELPEVPQIEEGSRARGSSTSQGPSDSTPNGVQERGPFGQAAVQALTVGDTDSNRDSGDGRVSIDRPSTSARTINSSGGLEVNTLEGWSHVVSSRGGVVSSSGSEIGEVEDVAPEWIFFEVADTGVGIGHKGLKSLFKEFVQGTEDEMKRPRNRGGTGLGLSICSKQVSVLGGRVGVLSKPNVGSIFWFCIPLRVPDPATMATGLELRRTASWGSRDAFTDGHLSHHSIVPTSQGQGKRGTITSRAHAFRKYHPAYKPLTAHAPGLCHVPSTGLDSKGGSDTDRNIHQGGIGEEQRRNSAPEMEEWQRPDEDRTPAIPVPKVVQRLTQPAIPPQPLIVEPNPTQGSSAASFSEAKALLMGRRLTAKVLSEVANGTSPAGDSNAAARKQARASHDLRASLSIDRGRTSLAQIRETSLERSDSNAFKNAPGFAAARPSMEEVRESALELDKITARKRCSLDQAGVFSAIRNQLGSTAARDKMDLLAAKELERNHRSSQEVFVTENGTPKNMQINAPPRRSMDNGRGQMRPNARSQMRPSMEARWRKLDVSALQGRRVLLAEDNLINQKVAQMMLTNLGMVAEVANNGQEAMEQILQSQEAGCQFHCVLMDMAMPVMGGVDATLAVRRAGISVPIVAMTANASDRDRDECLAAGMDGFLSKPVLKDRLAEAIMVVASGRGRYNADALVALKPYEAL